MDILIKGMEMPKNCNKCPFEKSKKEKREYIWVCSLTNTECENVLIHNKNCPLVELPPHGDLIERSSVYKVLDDRIAFYKEAGDDDNACNMVCIEGDIVAIPTIIEAST